MVGVEGVGELPDSVGVECGDAAEVMVTASAKVHANVSQQAQPISPHAASDNKRTARNPQLKGRPAVPGSIRGDWDKAGQPADAELKGTA
jgi:hypothetical protein